jgi:hypothetical protein
MLMRPLLLHALSVALPHEECYPMESLPHLKCYRGGRMPP